MKSDRGSSKPQRTETTRTPAPPVEQDGTATGEAGFDVDELKGKKPAAADYKSDKQVGHKI